jgi:hypothetical protein
VVSQRAHQPTALCIAITACCAGLLGSIRRNLAILTTDGDFDAFAKVLGFELHDLR